MGSESDVKDGGRIVRGRAGEEAAQLLLERRGYRIVDTNVRMGARRDGLPGEIDIVAWDGSTLCFIEVKTRRSGGPLIEGMTPSESVTPGKQRQIARLALAYAARHGLLEDEANIPLRFDIVAVQLATRPDKNIDAPDAEVSLFVRRADLVKGAFLAPEGFADEA